MNRAQALRDLDSAYGFWSGTGDPAVIDTAAAAGPDFICIDTQHGVHLSSLDTSIFTVIAQYGVTSLVRVEAIDGALIGRALDLGADGVVVPMVQTVDDAARAVAACLLAPGGSRSFGVQTRRLEPISDSSPICWIQIETKAAMRQLTEIASLDGVDGLYIGPADLGLALVGEPAADVESVFDGTHPHAVEMAEAFQSVVEACKGAGVGAGLHCGSGLAAVVAAEHGFTLAAVAADLGLIGGGLAQQLAAIRGPAVSDE